MYNPKEKVIWFAVTTRLAIIILQFIFNIVIPDHNAGVFISPLAQDEQSSIYDKAVNYLLGGLFRWDAQHFLHIAKYGYTYENSLAFSPLYPMAVRFLSIVLKVIFSALNDQSTIMIAALLINFLCFIKSAAVLYDLSKLVLKDTALAYKAAILYCVNPASIFFSAFYSEAMFACLSFHTMIAFARNNPYVYLPIGLSAITRSNGLTNIGFPLYSCVRSILRYLLPKFSKRWQKHSREELIMPFGCSTMFGSIIWLLNILFLSIAPYLLLQLYNYSLFCLGNEMSYPHSILKYGLNNDLIIAGTENPPWCDSSMPVAYSYVQKKYWDVGFLKYYTLRHIPNTLLGFPIVYIILSQSFRYLNENRDELFTLGSFSRVLTESKNYSKTKYPSGIFVFVIHGVFLSLFCILYVHNEVSTRLLCAASPLLYWYCALNMSHKSDNFRSKESREDFEYDDNMISKWKVFLLSQHNYSTNDLAVLSYFFGYVIVGCIMFPNFLPWT